MTITIRVQSPLLKRLFCSRRIEKLPAFPLAAPASRLSSPFAAWASSIAILCVAFSLAMVANVDAPLTKGIESVGKALVDQLRPDMRTEETLRTVEPFAYGAPPLQSMDSPRMRPSVAVGMLTAPVTNSTHPCVVGSSTVACR